MAEFIGVEEKAINVGDPLIFENKTDCIDDFPFLEEKE